jgi:hypothetical protein
LATSSPLPIGFISSSQSDETVRQADETILPVSRRSPEKNRGQPAVTDQFGESIMAIIKADTSTAGVWQAVLRRRAADIAAALGQADRSATPTDHRRRLAIPTVLASSVIGVALWAVAGQPVHPNKTLAAVQHARAR